MDYKDIRKKFCELSGRYDLITNTDEDNGADFFLNVGQRYLDRLLDTGKMIARYPVILTAGQYIAKTIDIRAIKEVWVASSSLGKVRLTPISMSSLRTEYAGEYASQSQGTPSYYTPAVFRPFPDTLTSTTGMYDISDLLTYSAGPPAQHFNYNGVIIMPPPSETVTVSIWGLFFSPTLTATLSGSTWTQTKSYWTEVEYDALIAAGCYKLESFYRNTEGMKDWQNTIMDSIMGIYHDAAEEDTAADMQMRG